MAKKNDNSRTPTIENRRARHDYFIEDTMEVGLKLAGSEVKSVRESKVSLQEGWVRAEGVPPQLILHDVHIAEFGPAGPPGNGRQHLTTRSRLLLAKKREIAKLARAQDTKGVTIVPLKIYFKQGLAKLLIGVARGKQEHDKRQAIAEREHKRDIDRAMSRKAR